VKPLPALMVAPNGARLTRADHPALPVTLPQIVDTARACFDAGADGLHLHLRDSMGGHVLDAGLYDEALAELALAVPELSVQITTESVGLYEAAFQRRLALATRARLVSVALREILADGDEAAARRMHEAAAERDIALQYILYAPHEVDSLAEFLGRDRVSRAQLLFVLGSHGGHDGSPAMLPPFLVRLEQLNVTPDWMVCAFGRPETDCLLAAHDAGGKLRVGFENNMTMRNGRRARDNAERVAEIRRLTAASVRSKAG